MNYIRQLLARFLPAPSVREKEVTVYRLSPEVFEHLAYKLLPSRPTTELDAAYQLGIQVALRHVKEGVVTR
ncbi:hypothetical protein UFOVP60_47 [uncultured Caudovirales phage]|uniref:Uncharacterized protein n=1 Tax=uncultured Caudovirales phage TaxID=2100421 RepID=A0A6J5T999_9CAUD|nr:hypothetical protein UFOVP60_47 [uncultured Caudovirales phage]